MTHQMNLNPDPFRMIAAGKKIYELRLYDEKRRIIQVGDSIHFTNTETQATLSSRVAALHIFPTFDELYQSLPLLQCGYTENSLSSASPKDMEQYYPKEKQALYAVVAIELTQIQAFEA